MKQLFLIGGLSLCSLTAFSQQQASTLKTTATAPVPEETKIPQESVSDSIVVNSMGKTASPVILTEPKSEENSSATSQKPVLNSMKRKPE